MTNSNINELTLEFLRLNKVLQNETFQIVDKIKTNGLSADNSLMLKSYTDMVSYIRDHLVGVSYDLRTKLHENSEKGNII